MKNGTNLRLRTIVTAWRTAHGDARWQQARPADRMGKSPGTKMVTGEELVTGYHHKLVITR